MILWERQHNNNVYFKMTTTYGINWSSLSLWMVSFHHRYFHAYMIQILKLHTIKIKDKSYIMIKNKKWIQWISFSPYSSNIYIFSTFHNCLKPDYGPFKSKLTNMSCILNNFSTYEGELWKTQCSYTRIKISLLLYSYYISHQNKEE